MVDDHQIATGRQAGRVGPDHDERGIHLAPGVARRDAEERDLPALQGLPRVAVREATVLQHVEEAHAGG